MPDIFVAANHQRQKKDLKKAPSKNPGRRETALAVIKKLDKNLVGIGNRLSTFVTFPDGLAFETQQKEEPIVLLLRPHWLTNVNWLFLALLMILAPLFLTLVPLLAYLPSNFQLIFIVLWYLFSFSFIFEKFLGWFFDIYLITDERVVDVDFYSLTFKQIADAGLQKIQDITYRTRGVLGSIFDYGDILIQTAGEQPNIEFKAVPRPAAVVKILNELITQEEQEMLEGRAR